MYEFGGKMKAEKVVNLAGELTIADADSLKKQMTDIIKKEKDITIDFSQLVDIDVAVLQLFFSLQKELLQRKGQVIFTGTISETLKYKLKLCGLISDITLSDTEILFQMNKLMGGV